MSVTGKARHLEEKAGLEKEAAGLLGLGDDLMGAGKSLADKIMDGADEAADTMQLMRDYPGEAAGYIGQKGKDLLSGRGNELAAGAAGAAGGAALSGDKKEGSVRERFGLSSEQQSENTNRFTNRATA